MPIGAELLAILLTYRQANGFVVRSVNSKGKWIYRFECDALFARVVKAAGVPKIRFHDMRHTYVSLALKSDISMFKVSQWLGHSDIRITQETYAHLAPYDSDVDRLQIGVASPDADISDPEPSAASHALPKDTPPGLG